MGSTWDPSKWEIHRLYSRHPSLYKLLPQTTLLSINSLSEYLDKYHSVYIKGKREHTGLGIIKAWKTDDGYRFVKVKGEPVDVRSIEDLYHKLKDGRRGNSVLVQRAIDLAHIKERPFSIRVMLMRDGKEKWQYAGMLAKVAGERSIVTNVRRGGGYATTIEDALAKSLGYDHERIESVKRELIDNSYKLIRYATKSDYRTHESGLDFGIDYKGKIWVIEVNLAYPSYELFNRLEDKKYYRRIKSLAAAYQKSRTRSR
ncbi:YheC/YheD family protein [Cohnella endophytica]|uniref:YheC/YheD family protein n=1 Tax=Cohnella endophytica TaxID=2419778 RepID=A0A494Y7B7_9BACL|nr:YheC/YheD family protein [Cohnella endophytica]RKP56218.1 YheC/YheD family protein [Cohnella endophytica]